MTVGREPQSKLPFSASRGDLMLVPTSGSIDHPDLVVVILGYEPRSSKVALEMSERARNRVALAYDTPGLFAYDENRRLLESRDFEIHPVSLELSSLIERCIEESAENVPGVAIDISSMSRDLMARTVIALWRLSAKRKFMVEFLYSPPVYDENVQPSSVVESISLIDPMFAGLAADPLSPVAAIIGVGFEPNLALGVSEYLDVASVHAFVPYGHDDLFDRATEDANSSLFIADTPCRRASYNLTRPYELYVRLESLVYGLSELNRVALVPLGPKIFSLCCILVALQNEAPIAVWRFSRGVANQEPVESVGESVRLTMIAT